VDSLLASEGRDKHYQMQGLGPVATNKWPEKYSKDGDLLSKQHYINWLCSDLLRLGLIQYTHTHHANND
jgi:hypothetical protein